MRLRAAAWFLPFVFIVWSVYFVPLLLNSRPSTGTNVKAAVLTKITYHTREGVTQEEARLALIKVVSKHFEDVLHVELKEHLQKSRGTTTTVPIFLWFRSVKEANEKKTVLEENKNALELDLQRSSLFSSVTVDDPIIHMPNSMTEPPSSPPVPSPPPPLPSPPLPPLPSPPPSYPSQLGCERFPCSRRARYPSPRQEVRVSESHDRGVAA